MNQKKQTLQHLNRNVKCFKKQPENAWNSTMERKHSYVKKKPNKSELLQSKRFNTEGQFNADVM